MTRDREPRVPAQRDRGADDLGVLFHRCSAGDEEARETIIVRFLPFARRLARRYEGRGEDLEDLVQVANVGLIKAVDRCSAERSDTFTAYAKPMILGEIRRHFRDSTWRVHVPRGTQERARRVASVHPSVGAAAGAEARTAAIAAHLNLTPSEVADAERAQLAYRPVSLDALHPSADGYAPSPRDVPAGHSSVPERVAVSVGITSALRGLGRRDQTVVLLRLGCDLSQQEIAARVGVSQMHISRILRSTTAAVAAACGLTS
jgi:RNA polymerase sigma-B factor